MTRLFSFRKSTRAAAQLEHLRSDDEEIHYKPMEWPLVKRLIGLLYPFRKQYAWGVGLGAIVVIMEMMSPLFMRHIINYVTDYRGAGGGHDAVAIRHVATVVIAWATTLAAALLIQRYNILIMTRAGEAVQFILRKRLFSHLQGLSMSYYD